MAALLHCIPGVIKACPEQIATADLDATFGSAELASRSVEVGPDGKPGLIIVPQPPARTNKGACRT